MIQIYITSNNLHATFIKACKSILSSLILTFVYLLCIIGTVYLINLLLNTVFAINIATQIITNVKSNTTLYLISVIIINIILYKLFLTMKFEINMQEYDNLLAIIVLIIAIIVTIQSYMHRISIATFVALSCMYSLITLAAYIDIFTDSYIIFNCKTYESNLGNIIIPVYYTLSNIPNDKLLLNVSQYDISIKQIPLDQCIENMSVKQYYQQQNSFFLDCHIKENIITKQTIYNTNGEEQKDFQYTIVNDNNIFVYTFKGLQKY